MTRVDVDGVHYEVRTAGDGPAILLLHGFAGRGADWAPHLSALRERCRVVVVDLLGHGRSDAPEDSARHAIERQAADLAEILRRLGARPAAVLGYSFGARVALRLAVDDPGAVDRLVLESPSAGIADADARRARREADALWVALLETGDLTMFAERWEAQPIFASRRRLPARVRGRLRARLLSNRPLALAASLIGAGQGAMEPLHTRLAKVTSPTLVLAGELDETGRDRAAIVARAIPGARFELVAGTGHAPHLEAPSHFRRLVLDFVAPDRPGVSRHLFPRLACEGPMNVTWTSVRHYDDIRYEHSGTGIAKVTICRPQVRNAFRPRTVTELIDAFRHIRDDATIGVALLTGEGDVAFCSGGDQSYKVRGGYEDDEGIARLNVLDLQRLIRSLPIPVIALVNGYAIGGGHVLHVVCDLSIASENAIFGQTGPKVGSFDAGYGATMLARIVGHKKAREIWYLCRQYDAREALEMGLVNAVVPLADLEAEGVRWAEEILDKSPTAIRFLKRAFNADVDGLAGIQELAGDATMLFYLTDEAHEGSRAFLEKRKPDFSKFPRRP